MGSGAVQSLAGDSADYRRLLQQGPAGVNLATIYASVLYRSLMPAMFYTDVPGIGDFSFVVNAFFSLPMRRGAQGARDVT